MTPLDPHRFGTEQMCFGCGPNNRTGMELAFFRDGEAVVTTLHAKPGWEGPPGIVHGGIQAALADEIAAWTVVEFTGCFGFTTRMQVRYLRPARHDQPIVARGELVEHTGSTARIRMVLTQNDAKILTGTASFHLPTVEQAERVLGSSLPDSWRSLARKD